jgi:hypothetical protein
MTQTSQSEAESASAETRALFARYQTVSRDILSRTRGLLAEVGDNSPVNVGRVTLLLREQKIILDELLGGK